MPSAADPLGAHVAARSTILRIGQQVCVARGSPALAGGALLILAARLAARATVREVSRRIDARRAAKRERAATWLDLPNRL